MIQKERLWKRVLALGEIGRNDEGGVTRLSFTEAERSAQALLQDYMKEANLIVRLDEVGNLIGRRPGRKYESPSILIGSHIDTVFNGGRFDGALGVLAGLEVLQSLEEDGISTDYPLEVIAFKDEEGARFSFGMMGSRGLAGTLSLDALEHADAKGITLHQAMLEAGLHPNRINAAARKPEEVKAYVELHIEQGKVLEAANLPVGIVQGISGLAWLKFVVSGEAGHAGATPMTLRIDPLAAAAEMLHMIEAEAQATKSAVATVGQLQVFPGGINIVPGRVEFTLDVRDLNSDVLNALVGSILEKAHEVASCRRVSLQVHQLEHLEPVPCSDRIQEVIRQAFLKQGCTPFSLGSGAGHDGMQFAGRFPIGMIFVRSRHGISHNPAEWTSPEDCALGAEILLETIQALSWRSNAD